MKKNNKITFGKYYTYKGVPCIELVLPEGHKGYTGRVVYLSAFRRYSFQVSATKSGSMALGETPVFGLETFANITQAGPSNLSQESVVKFFIHAVAMDGIKSFTLNSYGQGLEVPDVMYRSFFNNNDEWNKFIDETYKFAHRMELEEVPLEELEFVEN